jgi:hypothetical protein
MDHMLKLLADGAVFTAAHAVVFINLQSKYIMSVSSLCTHTKNCQISLVAELATLFAKKNQVHVQVTKV